MQLENFAYIASHDLKTPLRNIASFTQLLRRRLDNQVGDTEKDYFEYITQGTQDMATLIDDLLNYSLVQNASVNLEEVNLEELVQKVIRRLTTDFEGRQAQIDCDIGVEQVVTDPLKLIQLLQNLISNALKFTRPDEKPQVSITTAETATHWNIAVSDRGIGIDREYFDRIFLIFKRLHNKSTYEGTGIGLAICKKITHQLNGVIELESEVGRGSTFTVKFSKEIHSI